MPLALGSSYLNQILIVRIRFANLASLSLSLTSVVYGLTHRLGCSLCSTTDMAAFSSKTAS